MNTLFKDSQKLKSYFTKGLLASIIGAGAIGIWALLVGEFGELQGKVLVSTILVGLYSTFCLSCVALIGRRYDWVALAGIGANTIGLLLGLILIWNWQGLWDGREWLEVVMRGFLTFAVVGFSFAHTCQLLLFTDKQDSTIRTLLTATIGFIGLVAGMLIFPILAQPETLPDGYWRILGVFAILDVVGTIATSTLARFRS